MDIAPIILRLHPELDSGQRQVIGHRSGPLLVIAGPGAGKTRSIALRAVNLLLTGETAPGELALCTFGRDSALELQQRFRQAALACAVPGDLSRATVSTIHSLCHRVLAPHVDLADLRPHYQLLDEQEQHLLLHREFQPIFGPDWDVLSGRGWRDGIHTVAEAARYFDRLCDELIDPEDLSRSERPFIAALGRCCLRYRALLLARNAVDFAHLQVWAEQVLRCDGIAAGLGRSLRHLMVDEFQDTSQVQLRILSRLVRADGNIAVVGDDDQSIYRFRGASVANLLEFPRRFPGCRTVELSTNHRSHRDIVAACREWMETAAPWSTPGAGSRSFRYGKNLAAHAPETHADYPAVIAVQGADALDEARQLGELLRFLRAKGVIGSYGQVSLLLHSVKDTVSGPYLDGLESVGVPAHCEPAGHVRASGGNELLVTTIHQAKGREWEVVVVGSLNAQDRDTDRVGRSLAGYHTGNFLEPANLIAGFDRARRHYVAFTRARHLLVLTCAGRPHRRFDTIWDGAAHWPDVDRDALARQRFGTPDAHPAHIVVNVDRLDRLVVRVDPRQAVASPLIAAPPRAPQ